MLPTILHLLGPQLKGKESIVPPNVWRPWPVVRLKKSHKSVSFASEIEVTSPFPKWNSRFIRTSIPGGTSGIAAD